MTPDEELIVISEAEIEYVIESPSASEAATVPIAVWFSAALKVVDELKTGAS